MSCRAEYRALARRLAASVDKGDSARVSASEVATLRRTLDVRDVVGWASSFAALGLYLGAVWLVVPAPQVTWHWFGVGAVVSVSPFGTWFIQSRRGVRVLDRGEANNGRLSASDASKIVRPFRGAVAIGAWLTPAMCLLVLVFPA